MTEYVIWLQFCAGRALLDMKIEMVAEFGIRIIAVRLANQFEGALFRE